MDELLKEREVWSGYLSYLLDLGLDMDDEYVQEAWNEIEGVNAKIQREEFTQELDLILEKSDFGDERIELILNEIEILNSKIDKLAGMQNLAEEKNVHGEDEIRDKEIYTDFSNNGYEDTSDLWLDSGEIQYICNERGLAITGENFVESIFNVSNKGTSLEDQFYKFISNDEEKVRDVFIEEDGHWIVVHLEKTNDGITYQVADSLKGDGAKMREDKIDDLLSYEHVTKLPFFSSEQQNGHDCGIYAALNAVDMNNGEQKSTFDQDEINYVRAQSESHRDIFKQDILNEEQFNQDIRLAMQASLNEESLNMDNLGNGSIQIGNIGSQKDEQRESRNWAEQLEKSRSGNSNVSQISY